MWKDSIGALVMYFLDLEIGDTRLPWSEPKFWNGIKIQSEEGQGKLSQVKGPAYTRYSVHNSLLDRKSVLGIVSDIGREMVVIEPAIKPDILYPSQRGIKSIKGKCMEYSGNFLYFVWKTCVESGSGWDQIGIGWQIWSLYAKKFQFYPGASMKDIPQGNTEPFSLNLCQIPKILYNWEYRRETTTVFKR